MEILLFFTAEIEENAEVFSTIDFTEDMDEHRLFATDCRRRKTPL